MLYAKKLFTYLLFIYLLYMSVLPHGCQSTHVVQCLQRSEEGFEYPGTGITDSCWLPCGCQDPNPGPLQEWPVL